jgi:hypothetical protein
MNLITNRQWTTNKTGHNHLPSLTSKPQSSTVTNQKPHTLILKLTELHWRQITNRVSFTNANSDGESHLLDTNRNHYWALLANLTPRCLTEWASRSASESHIPKMKVATKSLPSIILAINILFSCNSGCQSTPHIPWLKFISTRFKFPEPHTPSWSGTPKTFVTHDFLSITPCNISIAWIPHTLQVWGPLCGP